MAVVIIFILKLEAVKEQIAALCPDEGDDALLSRYRQRILLSDAVSLLEQVNLTFESGRSLNEVQGSL